MPHSQAIAKLAFRTGSKDTNTTVKLVNSLSKLVPILKQTHQGSRWRKPPNFQFAAGDHLMPLGLAELRTAAMSLPAGFVRIGEKFMLVAVQGLRNGENLVLATSGKWLASHLPNSYQGYPFRMARIDQERYQICVREDSEFIRDAGDLPENAKNWHPLFDEEGNLGKLLAERVQQMQQHASDLLAAEKATEKLQELELIKEWDIAVREEGKDAPKQVRGLYTIDQDRLATLDGDALVSMRDCGALLLTYLQLFSAYNMPALVEIARRRWREPEERELDFGEADEAGNISFDNL